MILVHHLYVIFFFFNDTATTEIYTLSLHDALPICLDLREVEDVVDEREQMLTGREHIVQILTLLLVQPAEDALEQDRKSTRLNSSHSQISYAVFCLKKKKNRQLYNSHISREYANHI